MVATAAATLGATMMRGASTNIYIDVTDPAYGAVGDGVTDDTIAIQSAINAAASSGQPACVMFPKTSAYYLTSSPLVLQSYVTLRGVGEQAGASEIRNNSSDVFTQTSGQTLYSCAIENLYIDAYAGNIFELDAATYLHVSRCAMRENSSLKSIMDITGTGTIGGSLLECQFTENSFTHTTTATVPTFSLKSSIGSINCNTWRRNRFTYSGTYCIHIESLVGTTYCYDNVIREENFEVPYGGCVRLLSTYNTEISQCAVYDMTSATTRDLFYVGRSGTVGLSSKYTKFSQVQRRGGTLGTGLVDIRLQTAYAPMTTIEAGDNVNLNGFIVDLGNNGSATLIAFNTIAASNVQNMNAGSTTILKSGFIGTGNLGVGTWINSAVGGTSATKIPIYQSNGTLLGYIPVYPN